MARAKQPKKKQSAKAAAIAGSPEERQKKIADLVSAANKTYGKGALGTLRGAHAIKDTASGWISTGSIGIDKALGGYGVARGRVVEIYGPNGGGKTTLTLHIIAHCQQNGGVAAFLDAEHALHPEYADALGCNLEELLIHQPNSGEQALNLANDLIATGNLDLIVVDSVAALVPEAELNGEVGDQLPGAQARMMSQALRLMTAKIAGTNTCVIFINQIRHKIGVKFGSPETTSGGNALKFYASQRLDVRRIGAVKKGDREIGNRIRVKVVKNKLAPPFQKCEVDLIFGQGVSTGSELLDYGVLLGIVEKSGSWYNLTESGERLGQGRATVIQRLMGMPDITSEIREKAYVGTANSDDEEEGEDDS